MDYAALAKQYGGTSEAPVDYAALAKQFGGVSAAPVDSSPRLDAFVNGLKDSIPAKIGAGVYRGVRDVTDTLLGWGASAADAIAPQAPTLSSLVTGDRPTYRGAADKASAQGNAEFNARYGDSTLAGASRVGGNVIATLPVGGVLGAGAKAVARAVPAVAPTTNALANALTSGGFTTGREVAPNLLAQAGDMGIRMAGGAITGGTAAGLVNPEGAGAGALIGGALPPVVKGVGLAAGAIGEKLGASPVGQAYKTWRMPDDVSGAQAMVKALDMSPEQIKSVMVAMKATPADLVPGSKLTFAQALQLKGANAPGVAMLERTVAGGPGGDALLQRYRDQGEARMAALKANGAEVYQGAAADVADRTGNKIGAIVRTQAADDKAATRAAWQALEARAEQEGVALHLPLDEMGQAMGPLGRGSVGVGKDARAVLGTANEIGTLQLPEVTAGKEAKQLSLLDAVKRAGGINQNTVSSKMLGGEVSALKESGLGRVVYKNRGQSAAKMAEKMHEAGFLPNDDPAMLLDMLRNNGRSTFSSGADMESTYRAMAERAMGGAPEAQAIPQAVPFSEFQRLRRDAGALGRAAGNDPARGAESKVLGDFEKLLAARADEAAAGGLRSGDVMPPGFMGDYNAARGMTRADKQRYSQPNKIAAILAKPYGQDYALTGNEITNKLWHGGSGLVGDVNALQGILTQNNYEPALNALRGHVMTDAASKVTASGQLASAFPKYVESRMPGINELMLPEQRQALAGVAADIRNAEAAAAVPGLRGSDTQAKITRALDAGLLDSPVAKSLLKYATFKGIGGEQIRAWLAKAATENKGKSIAELLADPQRAAAALDAFVKSQGQAPANMLSQAAAPVAFRVAPQAARSESHGQNR